MPHDDTHTLHARLALLERRARRQSLALLLLVSGLAGAALLGAGRIGSYQQPTDTLTARRMMILDAQGQPAVVLGAGADGGFIALVDDQLKQRALLGSTASGATLSLGDQESQSEVTIGAEPEGAMLRVRDARGVNTLDTLPPHPDR